MYRKLRIMYRTYAFCVGTTNRFALHTSYASYIELTHFEWDQLILCKDSGLRYRNTCFVSKWGFVRKKKNLKDTDFYKKMLVLIFIMMCLHKKVGVSYLKRAILYIKSRGLYIRIRICKKNWWFVCERACFVSKNTGFLFEDTC